MPEKNLSALLERAQGGDRDAYEEFLLETLHFLRGALGRFVPRPEVREEIAQEVLIAVHKNLQTFVRGRRAEAWVMGIARYKVADYFRANPRQFEELADDVTIAPDATKDLEEALALLPENLRDALILTKIEGLSSKAAAGALGVRENALRTRVSRALAKLKEELLS
jgi:RNA polymerase sigma-70 factor (ECF subfamily)